MAKNSILFLAILGVIILAGVVSALDRDLYKTFNYTYEDFETSPPEEVSPIIEIILPENGSTVKGDFTSLVVETDENAICLYSLGFRGPYYGGGMPPVEMEITGGKLHMQQIKNLKETQEGENYIISVTCEDEFENSGNAKADFYVDLTEIREVMIIEDIDDYKYDKSAMIEIPESDEGILKMYFSYYDKGDGNLYGVNVIEFEDSLSLKEFLKEGEEELTLEKINENFVYTFKDEGIIAIIWPHENLIIFVLAIQDSAEELVFPSPLVEAYLEKYPSDLPFEVEHPPRTDLQRTLGQKTAPVTLEMFTDFEGPFDARWYNNTFPLIKKNYIDTGKVKLVLKHFPLKSIHPHAKNSAIAAECASYQNKFFEYIDFLYKNQNALSDTDLKNYAEEIGLDMNKFSSCFYNSNIGSRVEDDINEGISKGVAGVPAFFVNGRLISGAQPYEVFENAIEEELSKDTTPPTITLLDPDDNEDFETSKSDKTITFRYKVSDESNIASCSLIIDGDLEDLDNVIEKDVENIFRQELDSDEGYNWRIECVDIHGNKGISETRDFDIDKKKDDKKDNDVIRNTLDSNLLVDNSGKEKTGAFTPTIKLEEPAIKVTDQDKKTESPKNNFSLGEVSNIWLILLPVFGIGIVLLLILIVVFRRR